MLEERATGSQLGAPDHFSPFNQHLAAHRRCKTGAGPNPGGWRRARSEEGSHSHGAEGCRQEGVNGGVGLAHPPKRGERRGDGVGQLAGVPDCAPPGGPPDAGQAQRPDPAGVVAAQGRLMPPEGKAVGLPLVTAEEGLAGFEGAVQQRGIHRHVVPAGTGPIDAQRPFHLEKREPSTVNSQRDLPRARLFPLTVHR